MTEAQINCGTGTTVCQGRADLGRQPLKCRFQVEVPGTFRGEFLGGSALQSEPQAPGTPGEHRCPLSLQQLQDFIKESTAGLSKPLEEGDYEGLVAVMAQLAKVRERQEATDVMFEPLNETVELLKTYGDKMPEDILTMLQVGCLGCGEPGRALLGPGW